MSSDPGAPETAEASPVTGGIGTSRPPVPWSLRRRLVVGIGAVVAVVLIAVGVISIVTLNASVTTVVDRQLAGSLSALEHSVAKSRGSARTSTDPSIAAPSTGPTQSPTQNPTQNPTQSPPQKPTQNDIRKGFTKNLTEFVGHGRGTIIALVQDGDVLDSALFSDADATALSSRVVAQIAEAATSPDPRQTVQLSGLGGYRLALQSNGDGEVLVAGVSLAPAQAAVLQETIVIAAISAFALALTIGGVILAVRIALRPLDRVAATAVAVSTLPLESGDATIAMRLHGTDRDPRTEVGKVGESLNRMLDHVDNALAVRAATDKRMRRFVTDASHELRTPLAAIRGYAELTRQDSDELPALTEHALARIESEATRMSSLVSELLLLARLDEGQDLHLDEVDLSDLVATAVSDSRAAAPSHRWIAQVPDSALVVQADRERLHQLVVNLLSNASVHTPPESTVTARLRSLGDGTVRLTIADDGPGIPEELLPDLFSRFARGDASRSRAAGSTGLGLAIALSIVEAHHGQLDVASSPAGTTFTVILPVTAPH